ncbi:N4 RIIB-like protein [Sulfitobacter phage EE36phi1]|uniref:N4 RIIB-like protein n=1 Tax=Sulfitobacter phage EE36phi1 TaxID=490913 RepID=C4NTC2_9CAUD|nr:RIIB lysis inhibitor [Sulfitobacter phage EE36phi1]ACL81388.1 N4 RIIB-like protein [Sulfitobacter phage EE36phi1]
MSSNTKNIVSMLASEEKIMLITAEGQVLDMKNNGPYNTTAIAEYLTPKLDGKSVVPLDLSNYMTIHKAIVPEGYEGSGIVVTHMIDGKEVQGIFYPQKVSVAVQHEGREVVIPNVENLEKHAHRAATENSPAVRNFLRRLAPVVESRLHSAEDLMQFIKRSELPLTNDGLIIGYKKVNQKANGMFVDVHSGQIEQQVGSHVWMDVDAVDPSRNRSCSHGLHVANLGYLSGFGGSHTLIVLVDPANFIAVPHGETDKCRVCAYDVIGVMTAQAHKMVDSGSFVTSEQTFKSVIADAVAGRAIKPFEAVKVGTKTVLERVPLKGNEIPSVVLEAARPDVQPSGESLNTDIVPEQEKKDIVKMAKATKAATSGQMPWDTAPKEVIAVFEDLRLEKGSKAAIAALHNTSTRTLGRWAEKYDYDGYVKSKETTMTVGQRARMLFQQGAFEALASFKRTAKKSYSALGFNSQEISKIKKALA